VAEILERVRADLVAEQTVQMVEQQRAHEADKADWSHREARLESERTALAINDGYSRSGCIGGRADWPVRWHSALDGADSGARLHVAREWLGYSLGAAARWVAVVMAGCSCWERSY